MVVDNKKNTLKELKERIVARESTETINYRKYDENKGEFIKAPQEELTRNLQETPNFLGNRAGRAKIHLEERKQIIKPDWMKGNLFQELKAGITKNK